MHFSGGGAHYSSNNEDIILFIEGFQKMDLDPSNFGKKQKQNNVNKSTADKEEADMAEGSENSLEEFLEVEEDMSSSCSWRVRIALNVKGNLAGIAYDYKPVNLAEGQQLSEDYTKLNPLQYVPTLVDGDITVSDSLAIILYLEDKYPECPLLPADPRLKALNLQASSCSCLGGKFLYFVEC
eukprot:Gb_35794 [translate_table: standard]